MPDSTSEGLASFLAVGLFVSSLVVLSKASTPHHCVNHEGHQTLPDAGLGDLVRTTSLEINSYKEKDNVETLRGGWEGIFYNGHKLYLQLKNKSE